MRRDTFHIRIATIEDGMAVRNVLESCYSAALHGHYDRDILSEALPLLIEPDPKLLDSGRYYIGEYEGMAVACGGWSLEAPAPSLQSSGDHAFIRRFAVIPEFIGKGWGRALFRQCEAAIQEQPVNGMLTRSTLNAEPFYTSLGFGVLEPVTMKLPSGREVPLILMQRPNSEAGLGR